MKAYIMLADNRRHYTSAGAEIIQLINSRSLGDKPKGEFRLPINSHYPFPRVPKGSFKCHSCLVMNYIANDRHAHNPKVKGSNHFLQVCIQLVARIRRFLVIPYIPLSRASLSGRRFRLRFSKHRCQS